MFQKILAVIIIIAVAVFGFIVMKPHDEYKHGEHGMHHGGNGMGHGGNGMGHDMENMPGLQGVDATEEESRELAVMFNNFESISRTVTKLPNGIRTLTASDNPEVMDVLVSHIAGMLNRVDEGRDPQIFIQSPTLDIIFERAGTMTTEIDVTEQGVVVIQTSDDPEVVAALQTHADEVTAMADQGMQAVHQMMMERQKQH
jgi:hypothetical protein